MSATFNKILYGEIEDVMNMLMSCDLTQEERNTAITCIAKHVNTQKNDIELLSGKLNDLDSAFNSFREHYGML